MWSIFGDLKVVRFLVMCVFFMMSRYECFESNCVLMILCMMSVDLELLCKLLFDSFGIVYFVIDNSEFCGRINGKVDVLM